MPPDGRGAPPNHEALRAGERAYEAAQYADAARLFARAVAEDGSDAGAWFKLGNARWRRGDRTGAIEAYKRACAENPARARAWHNLSAVQIAAADFAGAAESATKAVALEPRRAKAWNNLGVARHGLGDAVGAETALRRALETDPAFPTAYTNLGRLLLATGRAPEAREVLERAKTLGENGLELRIALASALAACGEAAAGEALLTETVRATPSSAEAWAALGDVRRVRGVAADALEAFEAATAAAADLPDPMRAGFARRRLAAAFALALEASRCGDRATFEAVLPRMRLAAAEADSLGVLDRSKAHELAERCAEATAGPSLSAATVRASLLGALPVAPPPRAPGGPA